MRCNPKYFDLGDASEPFEVQEFDGRRVDLYYMNDFDTTFDQNLAQGRFAMWSSADGFNYRLYVEKGFHEEMKGLYSAQVNKIWLDYWDRVDKFTKTINFKILMPVCILLIGLLVLLTMLIKDAKVVTIVQIVLAAGFIVGMFMTSGFQKRKAQAFHNEAIDQIKEEIGTNNFDRLLKRQNSYIDEFLETRAKEAEAAYRAEHPEDFEDEITSVSEKADELVQNTEVLEETTEETQETEDIIIDEVKEEKELDEEKSNL